jgi:hypothetical protein
MLALASSPLQGLQAIFRRSLLDTAPTGQSMVCLCSRESRKQSGRTRRPRGGQVCKGKGALRAIHTVVGARARGAGPPAPWALGDDDVGKARTDSLATGKSGVVRPWPRHVRRDAALPIRRRPRRDANTRSDDSGREALGQGVE